MNKLQSWLSNQIKDFAVKNWEIYAIKKEWLAVILLLLLTKLATSAVSIFSGYQYLQSFFFGLVNSEAAASWFSIIALGLIEGLAALFLAKFFKFALRMQWLTAVMPLFFAILVFVVSFITSTNGIAIYTAQGVDLSNEINAKYNSLIEARQNGYAAECDNIKDHISSIKNNPEHWSNGQRCVLSPKQNEELAQCYDALNAAKIELTADVKALQDQQKAELADNATHTTNEADKYYNIVAVIMIIQVICSGALWFFWCKISGEDAPDIDAKEGVKTIYDKAATLIRNGVDTCINTEFNTITTAFATLDNELHRRQIEQAKRWQDQQAAALQIAASAQDTPTATTPEASPDTETSSPEAAPAIGPKQPQVFKIRGFGAPETSPETSPETDQKTATPEQPHGDTYGPVVTPETNGKKAVLLEARICPVCGRQFVPRAWNQRFCNVNGDNACKNTYWQNQGLNLDKIKKANAKR